MEGVIIQDYGVKVAAYALGAYAVRCVGSSPTSPTLVDCQNGNRPDLKSEAT